MNAIVEKTKRLKLIIGALTAIMLLTMMVGCGDATLTPITGINPSDTTETNPGDTTDPKPEDPKPEDPVAPKPIPEVPTELVFDNFDAWDDGTTYSTQNLLAYAKSPETGGGYWYAYSDGSDGTGGKITSAEGVDLSSDITPALGTGKLSVIFDCEASTAEYPYAGVEVPLTGKDTETYDLSKLTAIKIAGTLQGNIRIGFKSKKVLGDAHYGFKISSLSATEDQLEISTIAEPWSNAISVDKTDALTEVTHLFIALDVSDTNKKATVELDKITFVFGSEADKKTAFNFVN